MTRLSFTTCFVLLALVPCLVLGCSRDRPRGLPPAASPATSAVSAPSGTRHRTPGAHDDPGAGSVQRKALLRAVPERYEQVVARVTAPHDLFSNLFYEGHNAAMRGPTGPTGGLQQLSGAEIASRWRKAVRGARGVFLLRDALFSQQDHPYQHDPYALSMPPSWVTSALADLEAHRVPAAPTAPPIDDDAAWAALTTSRAMFGSFPPSDRLYELAHQTVTAESSAEQRALVRNARLAVASLARDARAMATVASQGADAVARAGAERIAAADRTYFGSELRHDRVIPVVVENPTRHEYEDEGKGMSIAGRDDVRQTAIRRARDAVYARRLLDGDLAIERYDLSRGSERARAIAVLEALIPRGSRGQTRVWLWVNGPLDPAGIRGQDATAYVDAFRRELRDANVELARLRLFSKPSIELPSDPAQRRSALDAAVDRFHALDLPLSVNLDTRALRALLMRP